MFGAAVPETAVRKECQPIPPKKKIRFAENFSKSAPAGDAVLDRCRFGSGMGFNVRDVYGKNTTWP
jgi:hypothetical protein